MNRLVKGHNKNAFTVLGDAKVISSKNFCINFITDFAKRIYNDCKCFAVIMCFESFYIFKNKCTRPKEFCNFKNFKEKSSPGFIKAKLLAGLRKCLAGKTSS